MSSEKLLAQAVGPSTMFKSGPQEHAGDASFHQSVFHKDDHKASSKLGSKREALTPILATGVRNSIQEEAEGSSNRADEEHVAIADFQDKLDKSGMFDDPDSSEDSEQNNLRLDRVLIDQKIAERGGDSFLQRDVQTN